MLQKPRHAGKRRSPNEAARERLSARRIRTHCDSPDYRRHMRRYRRLRAIFDSRKGLTRRTPKVLIRSSRLRLLVVEQHPDHVQDDFPLTGSEPVGPLRQHEGFKFSAREARGLPELDHGDPQGN